MGLFKQMWDVYKENGCELTLHRTVTSHLGSGFSFSAAGAAADDAAVAAFVTEMEAYWRDPEMFLIMLDVGLGGMFESESSFVGLLLREDVIQAKVIEFLLEKLSEIASEAEASSAMAMEKNIPKLILREIRWVNHVVDSRDLVEKLVGALPAFPASLQREVIDILPEIASDEDAHIVIDAMLEMIRNEADLVVTCVEALGNFNVENEQTGEVVQCVLERLDSSPIGDLPVIVKYLVQEAPGTEVELIADQLREKLSTTLSFTDTVTEAANGERRSSTETNRASDLTRNEEALVLGAIIQGFYFREDLMKAFITCISKCGEPSSGAMRLLDMWVLLAGHSIPRDRVKLEKLFKKKVSAGVITRNLIVNSVKGHGNALRSYFASVLQLASMLVQQDSSTDCMDIGVVLYEILFEEFSLCKKDGKSEAIYYQGEIVNSLLSYCLSVTNETTNAAFKALLILTGPEISFAKEIRDRRYDQSHFKRRHRFEYFLPALKQLLDVIENCSIDQVRYAYKILFAVGGADETELLNALRKQLDHQELRYRLYGMIGSVARVDQLLLQEREVISPREELERARTFNHSVRHLFERSSQDSKCFGFMLTELRRWVDRVDMDSLANMLIGNIWDRAMDILSLKFMGDCVPGAARAGEYEKPVLNGAAKAELWMNLDVENCVVYLRVLDNALSPSIHEQESLHYLGALVELVLECARKTNRMGEVESVLICPIQLVERSIIEDIAGLDDSIQNIICSAVWHAINWVRTIIGFYASETTAFDRTNVVRRLENLLVLESVLLDDLLHSCPTFGPPGMNFSEASRATSKVSGQVKKRGRPAKSAPSVDRAALVRASFAPMRADVLKIMAIPSVWERLAGSIPAAADNHQPQHGVVEFLMTLFEGIVAAARPSNKKHRSQSTLRSVFSDASRWIPARSEADEVRMITEVLEAICRFARHFEGKLRQIREQEEADPDHEIDIVLERTATRIVEAYFSISATIFDGSYLTSNEGATERIVQFCQAFFLPREHWVNIGSSSGGSATYSQIIESCFVSATDFRSIVGQHLSLAASLIRCLLGVASIAYGFPAQEAARRAPAVELKPSSRTQSAAQNMSDQISAMALKFLQQDWSRGDAKFVLKTALLDVLLASYLTHGRVVLDKLQALALDGLLALLEAGPNGVEAFPTLTKKTLPSFHRAMFDTLVLATARLDFDSSGLTKRGVLLLLNYFAQAVLLFKLLVGVTKAYQKSKLIANVLKIGRKFLEVLVRAMPLFQTHFVEYNELILKIISEVQVATRRMQVLCAHGKLIKDATAAAQVPMVKRLLERFIYRGHELATSHGVIDAFSTGVLKNKRIDGTTISKAELAAMAAGASSDSSSSEEEASEPETENGGDNTDEETKGGEDGDDDDQQESGQTRPSKRRR